MDCQDTDAKWYVLRVTYQRELSTKEYLDKLHVENFVPVRVVRRRIPRAGFPWYGKPQCTTISSSVPRGRLSTT